MHTNPSPLPSSGVVPEAHRTRASRALRSTHKSREFVEGGCPRRALRVEARAIDIFPSPPTTRGRFRRPNAAAGRAACTAPQRGQRAPRKACRTLPRRARGAWRTRQRGGGSASERGG